jgi:pimeloyl-ACP methyl ester carboxylesterase
MPYAHNDDIRIHYRVVGMGPPLLLHHGLTGSLESWRDAGYIDALQNEYQLILLDARGHGASDKPHAPAAYTMEHRVGDIIAVLDDLDIASTHFFGYSYGGRAGLEFATLAPHRARSLIIGGAGAGALNPQDPNPVRDLFAAGPKVVLAKVGQFGPVSASMRAHLFANDMEALVAILNSPRPNLETDLSALEMPFLVYVGAADEMYDTPEKIELFAKRLAKATFVSLPGLNHTQAIERSDLVLPHVQKFLRQVCRI